MPCYSAIIVLHNRKLAWRKDIPMLICIFNKIIRIKQNAINSDDSDVELEGMLPDEVSTEAEIDDEGEEPGREGRQRPDDDGPNNIECKFSNAIVLG